MKCFFLSLFQNNSDNTFESISAQENTNVNTLEDQEEKTEENSARSYAV